MISKFSFQRQKKGALKYLILECLNERPMRVYEIIKSIENKFDGYYRPSTGSVYPMLKNMIEEELISVTTEGNKKIYSITEKGKMKYNEMRENYQKFFGNNFNLIKPIFYELLQIAFLMHENKEKINKENSEKILEYIRRCKDQIREVFK
ncbi:MAG: PadR family transcriptional regulator [Saccharolobus sp.]